MRCNKLTSDFIYFDFTGSRLEDQIAIQRFFTLVFFAYTYLSLTRDPLCEFYEDAKSMYDTYDNLKDKKLEEVIEWIYIKSNFGL